MEPPASHPYTFYWKKSQTLTQWLPNLSLLNIDMKLPTFSTRDRASQHNEIDMEKGIAQTTHDTLQAIATPEPATNKEGKVFSNESFTSSTSTLTVGKHENFDGFQLPKKKHTRTYRNLRYTFCSVYHRLNFLVIVANAVAIAVLALAGHLLDMNATMIGTAAAANIVAAVLVRQELVINLLFASFGMCPRSMPLRIRRLAAKIYHLGGVHSGAGIAATIWFGVLNYPVIQSWRQDPSTPFATAIFALTITLDVLLVSIVSMSHPNLRAKFHNTWEMIHRFAGWASVGLFWAHMILSTEARRRIDTPTATMAQVLIRNPIFWCLFVVTIALALPWFRLRKVPVRAEELSSHVTRLHFGYANLPLCAAPRFSDSPLKEWHAFAGIPEEDGIGFSILVSKAGDWTSKIIQSPPRELWVKGIPTRGVLHVAPIFRKLVLVATGSGIGPILSLLYARDLDARIIWSAPDPLSTYKESIVDQIKLADPDAVIINTTKSGRPDLVREAYKLYLTSKAEAVFIISNQKVTRKVVYGLESRGVPIFAPIFDS